MTLAELKKKTVKKSTTRKTKASSRTSSAKKSNGRSKKQTKASKTKSKATPKTNGYSWEIVKTAKRKLVEGILTRWENCMPDWPLDKEDKEMPSGYIHCGFKGIFVGFRGDVSGEIIDNRNRKG